MFLYLKIFLFICMVLSEFNLFYTWYGHEWEERANRPCTRLARALSYTELNISITGNRKQVVS